MHQAQLSESTAALESSLPVVVMQAGVSGPDVDPDPLSFFLICNSTDNLATGSHNG
jgi:hypothetical protein